MPPDHDQDIGPVDEQTRHEVRRVIGLYRKGGAPGKEPSKKAVPLRGYRGERNISLPADPFPPGFLQKLQGKGKISAKELIALYAYSIEIKQKSGSRGQNFLDCLYDLLCCPAGASSSRNENEALLAAILGQSNTKIAASSRANASGNLSNGLQPKQTIALAKKALKDKRLPIEAQAALYKLIAASMLLPAQQQPKFSFSEKDFMALAQPFGANQIGETKNADIVAAGMPKTGPSVKPNAASSASSFAASQSTASKSAATPKIEGSKIDGSSDQVADEPSKEMDQIDQEAVLKLAQIRKNWKRLIRNIRAISYRNCWSVWRIIKIRWSPLF